MTIQVTVFHNMAHDAEGRHLAWFDGYKVGHPLTPVFQYESTVAFREYLTGEAYRLFNVGDDPDFGAPDKRAVAYRSKHNRSLSVGDVIKVDDGRGAVWLACIDSGWARIPRPEWFVYASCHGTTALDAQAHEYAI